jgi:hypothetical protein
VAAALKKFLTILLLGSISFPVMASTSSSHWAQVKHLIGFGDAAEGAKGDLLLTQDSLSFGNSGEHTVLLRRQVKSVQVGSERVETGGFAGKAVRIATPYGGGALLGTITQRNVGILTIRYADTANGIHDAVFAMPRAEAMEAQEWISGAMNPDGFLPTTTSCNTHALAGPTIRIVTSEGEASVAEYGALIYEHLVEDVRRQWPSATILRGADENPTCRAETIAVTIQSVAKGNAMVRTVSGPIGLFADVTHVHAHAVLTGPDGIVELDKIYSTSRRGDRESLNVAASLAQKVAKDVRKVHRGTAVGGAEDLQ